MQIQTCEIKTFNRVIILNAITAVISIEVDEVIVNGEIPGNSIQILLLDY